MNWGGFNAVSYGWLATLAAPLVLFYFLKLKRPRLQVPSLTLWRQVLQDNRVNSPFQKFKRNLLLWLQLLILALLVLAAMQPYWRGREGLVRRLPVLIDCSASMGALDKEGGITRLQEAKRRVRELIDRLAGDQELCFISFGKSARKLTGFTNDKRELRDALESIHVENVPSDCEEALRLAQALARTTAFDEVLLVSDGNFPARVNFDLPFKLNYQQLTPAGPNVGLTALSARRSVNGGWDVFVQIEGSAEADGNMRVEVTQDGAVVGDERVTLVKGRAERMVFPLPGEKAVKLQVNVRPDRFDSLAADNVASLELPASRPLRVYVAKTLGSYRRVLAGMSNMSVTDDATSAIDLAVSDQSADEALVARARLWVGQMPTELMELVRVETNGAQVVDWRRESVLLQHVQMNDLVILEDPHWRVETGEADAEKLGYEVLVHGQHGPLMVERRTDDGLTVAVLFHTDHSTLPYRVGFPVFVANVAQAAMEQAGLAEAHGTGGVLSPSETSLASVDKIQFNEQLSVKAETAKVKTDRALWSQLTFSALMVLLVEWWYFQRKHGGRI